MHGQAGRVNRRGWTSGARRRALAALAGLAMFGASATVIPDATASTAAAGNWALTTSPTPAGMVRNQLNGISCPSVTVCVGVGYAQSPAGSSVLIETLGTSGWALATAPNGPGSYMNVLEGISCTSPSSCVAVGYSQQKGGPEQTLVETLSEGSWTVTSSPSTGAGNNQLTGVSCSAQGACVAVGYYESTQATCPLIIVLTGSSWAVAKVPGDGAGDNQLNGVSCATDSACVAVGYYVSTAGVDRALVETLTAGAWSVTSSPDQGQEANQLSGVSCTAATACEAVGSYRTGPGAYSTLVETFASGGWALTSSPDVKVKSNQLEAVSCTSPTSCAAVGEFSNGGQAATLALKLDGTSWSRVTTGNQGPNTSELAAVRRAAGSPASCSAVGYFVDGNNDQALAETAKPASWGIVASADLLAPYQALNSVSCPSAGSCVAVGGYDDAAGNQQVLIEQLAGGTWEMMPGGNPGVTTNNLNTVSCASAGSCVAVGYYIQSNSNKALAETLSGGNWVVTPPLDEGTGGDQLNGVSCPEPGSCVAVGFYTATGAQRRVLIETLSNGAWTVPPSAAPGNASAAYLESVSCTSVTTCVAVGYDFKGNARRTLIEALANGTWTVVPSPDQGTGDNLLDGVSCSSSTSCVAVGYYFTGKAHLGLVETLTGRTWAVTTSPNPSATGDYPAGVSCTQSRRLHPGRFVLDGSGRCQQRHREPHRDLRWRHVVADAEHQSRCRRGHIGLCIVCRVGLVRNRRPLQRWRRPTRPG